MANLNKHAINTNCLLPCVKQISEGNAITIPSFLNQTSEVLMKVVSSEPSLSATANTSHQIIIHQEKLNLVGLPA